ncbi:MAG: DinB family protein [Archangium sp.]
MSHELRDVLLRQFDISWALTEYHLNGLTTEECLWKPAELGLHVHELPDGSWSADWPDREGYDIGPSSIGWITWHMVFWWASVLDHSFGSGKLTRDVVEWPGSAKAVVEKLDDLQAEWRAHLNRLNDEDLRDTKRTKWPFTDKPFADVVGWLNVELMKNAAELGYARFLFAVRR